MNPQFFFIIVLSVGQPDGAVQIVYILRFDGQQAGARGFWS